MPFVQNTTPTMVKQPKLFDASIGNGDAQAWKLLLDNLNAGAGPNGSKVVSANATSTDTSARVVQLAVARSFTGATVTIATPGVVSWTSANGNNVAIGDQIIWINNGDTLPTGLAFGTPYFVISAGFTVGVSFELSATAGGAAINTTGSQSGTHVIAHIRPIAAATVAITSGTDGVTARTSLLSPSIDPGQPFDSDGNPFVFLETGDYLAVQAVTTVTANKIICVNAIGANF
jgi:hypothetical protein